jgi:methionine aminotransferase
MPQSRSRLPHVGTTIFTVMSDLAARTGSINLAQGFPDFEPPARLRELVASHVSAHHNQYAPMAGAPVLREAIAAKIARHYGRQVSPGSDITVTCGGTEALACSILCAVEPGDEVVVFDPAYDSYEPIVTLCGGITRHVPLTRPGFGIDWQRLADAMSERTRLIIINTPHNPSGTRLSAADLEQLAAVMRPSGAWLLSDEVYEHMVYDGIPHASVHGNAELAARSFVASSFGKTYHATGWKIGYCVAPPELSAELRKVHQFVTFAIATPLQYAIADFMGEHPEHETELPLFYAGRRDYLRRALGQSRFRLRPTPATYFQLVDYGAISDEEDTRFVHTLIERCRVAAIPLSPFSVDPLPGERLLRLCFAKEEATLAEAAGRLATL